MTAIIYAFRSPGSGAVYIGKHQCDPGGWPRRGTGKLPDGYAGSGVAVASFHRRHGDRVEWRILAAVDGDRRKVDEAERRAIRLARALFGRACVNLADGGEGWSSEEARAASAAAWSDPNHVAMMRDHLRNLRAAPDHSDKMRAAANAIWSDPNHVEKMRGHLAALSSDPEVRAKISAAAKARCADPKVRAEIGAASRARWADPAFRAKMSAAQKASAAKRKSMRQAQNRGEQP